MKNNKNIIENPDLEFAIADVISSYYHLGTKFTQDGDHGYQGRLWDYKEISYKINIVGPDNLNTEHKKISRLCVISACDISSYTDVPNPEMQAKSALELAKFDEIRPNVYGKIKITFSKKDLERMCEYPYFLCSLGPDFPGDDRNNVKKIECILK